MTLPEDASHWRELFDHLDDVLAWVKDRAGRYVWVNRAFLLNHALEHPGDGGPNAKGVLGKTDYDLSPVFLADQYRIDDEQVLAGKRIFNRIERVGESESDAHWNITQKIPVRDRRGRIIGTAGISRALESGGVKESEAGEFGAVLDYMRENYRRPISNQQLARVARMSLRAFERHFLSHFHLTPQRYLRKLRLGVASRALVAGSDTLAEVALASGFGDQSHFTREFRRHFGRTPREYREHYKAALPLLE